MAWLHEQTSLSKLSLRQKQLASDKVHGLIR